jgi:hypothetical protein
VLKLGGAIVGVTMASAVAVAMCPATTVENQFNGSAAGFIGRVVDRQVVSIPAPPGHQTEMTFEVEDVWKGPSDKMARISERTASLSTVLNRSLSAKTLQIGRDLIRWTC